MGAIVQLATTVGKFAVRQFVLRLAAAGAVIAGLLSPAMADTYPSKPIRMIVNFSPGGTTDVMARLVAKKAGEVLGTTIVVENKAGAGGTIGVAHLAQQPGDGYWIGTANMPSVGIIPQIRPLPYVPGKDVFQAAVLMPYEYVILARKDAPYNTWEELVAYAKKNPGKVTYASPGTGTTNHLTMERIAKILKIKWRHVPFKSGTKALAAVAGGHVDLNNASIGAVVSTLRAGKIKALLVTSEKRLSAVIPDVPTMAEKGLGFSQLSYLSVIVPKGVPDDVKAKLEAAIKVAVEDKGVQEAAAKLDMHPAFMSGKDYTVLLARLRKEWGELLEELKLKKKS